MCQSAGLRKCSPVIRFEDEYGSSGSSPTPFVMQRKVFRDLFKPAKELKEDLEAFLYGRMSYNPLKPLSMPKIDMELMFILDYFSSFVGGFASQEDAINEFCKKTLIELPWSISGRNMATIIHQAMVDLWRRDDKLMGRKMRSKTGYIEAMSLELNGHPKLVRTIPPSALKFIAKGAGTQIFMAKSAHPYYE